MEMGLVNPRVAIRAIKTGKTLRFSQWSDVSRGAHQLPHYQNL
jgi:hypothetical protein